MSAADLKQLGNEHYAAGRVAEALDAYRAGVEALLGEKVAGWWQVQPSAPTVASSIAADRPGPGPAAVDAELLSVLYSNASQALFDRKAFLLSATAAHCASGCAAQALKPAFRHARALLHADLPFEAFIDFFGRVEPLLRVGTRQQQDESQRLVGDLREGICRAMSVADVSDAFGLRRTAGDGGYSTVATKRIAADAVIFAENQWCHPLLDAASPSDETSTNELVSYFSKQLVAAVRRPGGEGRGLWAVFTKAMRGSWPRSLADLDPSIVSDATAAVERDHAAAIADGAIAPTDASDGFSVSVKELTHMALILRYNCFHSGFFRICALANHSCDPNAAMKYVPQQKKVVMVAVKDIAPGEDIRVKYFADFDYMMGVTRRRELLHRSWLFWCDCARCDEDLHSPAAVQEFMKCPRCESGYVHLPLPPMDKSITDPEIRASAACPGCASEVSWSDEHAHCVYKSLDTLFASARTPGLPVQALSMHLMTAWSAVADIVHDDHWVRRAHLYCYAFTLRGMLSTAFGYVAQRQWTSAEASRELMRTFGFGGGRNGGDLLCAVRDLWRRIQSFYPPSQAWALHVMAAQLIALNLMQPQHPAALSTDACVEQLALHAPHCGVQERQQLHRIIQVTREAEGSTKSAPWTAKQTREIKKILS